MLMVSQSVIPSIPCPLNSRFLNATAYSTHPLGHLMHISNGKCQKQNAFHLPQACSYSASPSQSLLTFIYLLYQEIILESYFSLISYIQSASNFSYLFLLPTSIIFYWSIFLQSHGYHPSPNPNHRSLLPGPLQ